MFLLYVRPFRKSLYMGTIPNRLPFHHLFFFNCPKSENCLVFAMILTFFKSGMRILDSLARSEVFVGTDERLSRRREIKCSKRMTDNTDSSSCSDNCKSSLQSFRTVS